MKMIILFVFENGDPREVDQYYGKQSKNEIGLYYIDDDS